MSDRTESERLNPRTTRARTGGQPHQSVQQANARGRVVVAGSAPPSNPTEERRQRYIEEARRARAEMGFFGHVDAAVRGAANTLTFGGADALAAGGDALFGSGEGATIGERYRDNRMRQEAITQADGEVHGPAGEAGEFVAGLVPYERGARVAVAGYRAVRGGGERILRSVRGRRGGRACRTCSKRPVALADGVKVTQDVDFELPGLPLLQLSRVYAGDLDFSGPLGRNRIGAFDEAIALREDGTVHYLMGSGLEADFALPSAGPGAVSRNVLHPDIALSRAPAETFEIRARGVVSRFSPYAPGVWLLMGWSDANGHGVTLHREASGLLERAERSDGFAFVFENDADGLRLSATLVAPDGASRPVSRYVYDSRGNLVGVANAYARSFHYGYDDEDRFAFYDDGVHTRVDYEYDEAGRVSSVRTPGGRSDHDIAYRPDLRETTVIHHTPQGPASTTYRFDEGGRTIEEIDPLGHVTRFERDEAGNILAETDPEGNRTSYGVDTFGFLAFAQDAEGRRTSYRHDADGRLEGRVEGDGAAWQWGYDERGNILFERDPLGHRTDFHTDANGLPVGIMRHDGLIERRSYDAQHRLVRVVDFGGNITRFQRDAFGRVVARADAMGHVTRFEYDERTGADFWTPSLVRRSNGTTITRYVDRTGGRVIATDGQGRRTTYVYGAFELLKEVEDPKGGRLRFGHDWQDRLISVENQNGERWRYERDLSGHVISEAEFSGLAIRYRRDRAGRLAETHWSDGTRISHLRDRSGLVVREEGWCKSSHEPDVRTFGYDARGNLIDARNDIVSLAFERDRRARIVREAAHGRSVLSTYDCCGNRIARSLGGRMDRVDYDPMGAPVAVTLSSGAAIRFEHDALGRETQRYTANGFRLEQQWDEVGQLRAQRAVGRQASHGAYSVERLYRWSREFSPLQLDESHWGTTSYREDEAGQIIARRYGDGFVEQYSYGPTLDLDSQSEEVPEPSVTAAGGRYIEIARRSGERIVLTYDERQNVVRRSVERKGFRPKVWLYEWDAFGQLSSCASPTGDRWRYGYDPLGRRLFKRRQEALGEIATKCKGTVADGDQRPRVGVARGARSSDGPGSTDLANDQGPIVGVAYQWDGDIVVEQAALRLGGVVGWENATRWHYEPGTFVPLAREEIGNETGWAVPDHLGTPREIFSSVGELLWTAELDTWGQVRRSRATGLANDNGPGSTETGGLAATQAVDKGSRFCPIRFQGQWADEESGLSYNRFRYYDAAIGHYVSPDPIGLAGGLNAFAYSNISPAVEVDPLGLAGRKTTATGESGRSYISGTKPVPGYNHVQDDVIREAGREAGWQPRNMGALDRNKPGSFNCCHAEQKAYIGGERDIHVDSGMCPSCRDWFGRVTRHRNDPATVTDPFRTRRFPE